RSRARRFTSARAWLSSVRASSRSRSSQFSHGIKDGTGGEEVKIKVTVSMSLVGCVKSRTIDVPDEDLRDCSDAEKDAICQEYADEVAMTMVSWDWGPA